MHGHSFSGSKYHFKFNDLEYATGSGLVLRGISNHCIRQIQTFKITV